MAIDPERLARLEEKDTGHQKDISRLEDSLREVVSAVKDMGKNVSDEISGLRGDIANVQQKRARDIGFIAGISAAVSFIMGTAGLALEFFFGGLHGH